MEREILDILNELKPGEDFTASTSYIDDGVLDSFDVISLVSILEEKYNIIVDGLDIIPENFKDINMIVQLINKSKKA